MQCLGDYYFVNYNIECYLGQIGFLTVAKASRRSSKPNIWYLTYALAIATRAL